MLQSVLTPIHREGWRFIAIFAVVTVILWYIALPLGLVGLVLTLWCIYFFRDPARVTPTRAGLVIAPADGVVQMIQPASARTAASASSMCQGENRHGSCGVAFSATALRAGMSRGSLLSIAVVMRAGPWGIGSFRPFGAPRLRDS